MAYWAVARHQLQRERLACHCLALEGFEVYFPRLRQIRRHGARKIESSLPLFPGYFFVRVLLQWRRAHWGPGLIGLIMDGNQPARVSDTIIAEIRARERNGLVELPRRPLQPGDRVRVCGGPLSSQVGLYAGMRGSERVLVLLALLGAEQRVMLPKADVEALPQS